MIFPEFNLVKPRGVCVYVFYLVYCLKALHFTQTLYVVYDSEMYHYSETCAHCSHVHHFPATVLPLLLFQCI
jgi:hypothetical protein